MDHQRPSNGRFDGVMAAVGTCGEPKMPHIPGQDKFKGQIFHPVDWMVKLQKARKYLSSVEVRVPLKPWVCCPYGCRADKCPGKIGQVDHTTKPTCWYSTRTQHLWPGNDSFLDTGVALRLFFYRDLRDLAPTKKGIFTDTPMVSIAIMQPWGTSTTYQSLGQFRHLPPDRSGKAKWLRGDIIEFTENGIRFNQRAPKVFLRTVLVTRSL
jgi:hypothetical protein